VQGVFPNIPPHGNCRLFFCAILLASADRRIVYWQTPKTATNRQDQASPTLPAARAKTLSSEAVLDALKIDSSRRIP